MFSSALSFSLVEKLRAEDKGDFKGDREKRIVPVGLNGSLDLYKERNMPHRSRPVTALLLFTGVNAVLCATITPVYDFVCFHPYWERRRERHRQEREAVIVNSSS